MSMQDYVSSYEGLMSGLFSLRLTSNGECKWRVLLESFINIYVLLCPF